MTPVQTEAPPVASVVVPAYNEEATLAAVVEKLLDVPRPLEVVVVDDRSNTTRAEAVVAPPFGRNVRLVAEKV